MKIGDNVTVSYHMMDTCLYIYIYILYIYILYIYIYIYIYYQAMSYGSALSSALLWQYAHVYVTTKHCFVKIRHAD